MKRTKRLLTFLLCLTFVLSPLASAVEAGSQQETEVVPVVDADEQETATKPDEVEMPEPSEETPPVEEPQSITVTYQDGETVLLELTLTAGEAPTQVPRTDVNGNQIFAWVTDGRKVTDPAAVTLTRDTVYTVWSVPALNTEDHIVYINGQGEGQFAPNGNLTRAAAAQMIFSLLKNANQGVCNASFSDVASGLWYSTAITTLASLGIVNGYGDGTFCPDQTITRAEFVSILSSFYPLETGNALFSDVPRTHWAYSAVLSAAAKGWINGYEDGRFCPDQTITRAEAVTVLNAVLGRSAAAEETQAMISSGNLCLFTDVKPDAWYYAAVMEASIPHDYTLETGTENWTSFTYKSCGYESGFQKIGNAYYIVDENQQITFQQPGMQTLEGKIYYVASDGSIPAYASGPQEIGNALYYINADGSILINGTVGYLSFGADGRYSSGNAQIDALVEQTLAACTNGTMTRAEKLRAAYLQIREYRYLSKEHYGRGTTNWYESTAIWMLQNKRGNCYCYSSAFMYVARRLGYQAYCVSGGYNPSNSDHAWVMIGDRIYDPCLENVYRYRSSVVKYYDLYNILPSQSPIIYHFPG